jgi:hypothetical protein
VSQQESLVKGRLVLEIENATILIGSDAHYWPGEGPTTAHSALVRLARELNPDLIVMNGDLMEGASISHYKRRAMSSSCPTIPEELEIVRQRLSEIEAAAPEAAWLWPMGNHDARFEQYILEKADMFADVYGTRLKDHFPNWQPCWSIRINDGTVDQLTIKHRLMGGPQALIRNSQVAGTHYVTGHTHGANVWARTNDMGTFWSVDTGTIANTYSDTFGWLEDAPRNWRSSVTVLTIIAGKLLPPSQLLVIDEQERRTAYHGQVAQEEE